MSNFSIFRKDPSNKADFVISARDAIILSIYTSATFVYNERLGIKFNPLVGGSSYQEQLQLRSYPGTDLEYIYRTNELTALLSLPISKYLELFPDFKSEKYLFIRDPPVSRRGNIGPFRFKEFVEETRSLGLNPTDCIVWAACGSGEDFWEYVTGLKLREMGYFVGNYTVGGGDIYGYYIPEYLKALVDGGLLSKGAFIEELELLPQRENAEKLPRLDGKTEIACVEAESYDRGTKSHSTGSGIGQLEKYISVSTFYTQGFVAGPYCTRDDFAKEDVGLCSCDEEGRIVFKESKHFRDAQEEHESAVRTLIRCALLLNLPSERRFELSSEARGHKPQLHEYFEDLASLDLKDVISCVKSYLLT